MVDECLSLLYLKPLYQNFMIRNIYGQNKDIIKMLKSLQIGKMKICCWWWLCWCHVYKKRKYGSDKNEENETLSPSPSTSSLETRMKWDKNWTIIQWYLFLIVFVTKQILLSTESLLVFRKPPKILHNKNTFLNILLLKLPESQHIIHHHCIHHSSIFQNPYSIIKRNNHLRQRSYSASQQDEVRRRR